MSYRIRVVVLNAFIIEVELSFIFAYILGYNGIFVDRLNVWFVRYFGFLFFCIAIFRNS